MKTNKSVELLQNISFEDTSAIGKSLSILARFAQEKLPVSQGFVITALGFSSFLDLTELRTYFKNFQKYQSVNIDNFARSSEVVALPKQLTDEVKKCYAKISGFSEAFVNLRALVLDRHGNEISHRSFSIFDVQGDEDLLTALKTLYKDILFDNKAHTHKFFENHLQIVVLVQKAIQAEASGVMFTTDVITKDKNKLVVEAVYGLESVVGYDAIVPDQYIFDKTTNSIVEKHITKQEFMVVRQSGLNSSNQKVDISEAWQKRQKLDDKHILTLARTGKIIEEGIGEAQEIIWSYEGGKVWINFIENSEKLSLKDSKNSLQELVDEEVFKIENPKDLEFSIPDNLQKHTTLFTNLAIEDEPPVQKKHRLENEEVVIIAKNERNLNSTNELMKNTESTKKHNKKSIRSDEPLLEGKYYAGGEAVGEISFDAKRSTPKDILVLKGDENLAADISVAGFIIEDASDVLAEKLNEYFQVPVITGVPLARKILKAGEKVHLNGESGFIYETLPYSEQIGEIEMNFVSSNQKTPEKIIEEVKPKFIASVETETIEIEETPEEQTPEPAYTTPLKKERIEPTLSLEDKILTEIDTTSLYEELNSVFNNEFNPLSASSDPKEIKTNLSKETPSRKAEETPSVSALTKEDQDVLKEFPVEQKAIPQQPKELRAEPKVTKSIEAIDISKLLELVEDDTSVFGLQDQDIADEVSGVNEKDQFNLWGSSLEKVMTASKSIPSVVASEALEHVIEDRNSIVQNSKEFAFDAEEEFIAQKLHHEETNKTFNAPFIPTATKVYVNLVDERLPTGFNNFDGIIFSSSMDMDIYFDLLENALSKSGNKEVLAVTPPYELKALEAFLTKIHNLRNKGYRNLSLVLPDYRNKKEITEIKKMLSSIGLKRSSTFEIYANLSRTINVFRIEELNKSLVDGVYIDLFRLKMNMLGVEKLSASTKYVEGMRNLVEYINDNFNEENKSLVNISCFGNTSKVLDHILRCRFTAVVCGLANADGIKKKISTIENKSILESKSSSKKIVLKKRS